MSAGWIRHQRVSCGSTWPEGLVLSTPWFGFGVLRHPWGWRFLLGTWHLCLHTRSSS